jgi:glycosyltransferase involved in cell wall biosynthesis
LPDIVKVVHFHNGTGGGVLSVIRNLLAFSQHGEIENYVIYTINRDNIADYKVPELVGAISEKVFYYSSKWNFNYTCRKLSLLLPDKEAIIVAHDWLELGMVSNIGIQNPVVHYVHGAYSYYYSLALRHSPWVNCYITVSQHIADELSLFLSESKKRIHYLKFPVPNVRFCENSKSPTFQIVFAGRCEEAKGYWLLPEIDKLLIANGIKVQWHIAGIGSTGKSSQLVWPKASNVKFHGELVYDDLMQLLCKSHVFILPSKAEGMPLSVIEAMYSGAIPMVNDLLGGLQELIEDGLSGFLVPNNQVEIYAKYITALHSNEAKWRELSNAAKCFALAHFNPSVNTSIIEAELLKLKKISNTKNIKNIYGSRLDHPMIPNFFTNLLRNLFT